LLVPALLLLPQEEFRIVCAAEETVQTCITRIIAYTDFARILNAPSESFNAIGGDLRAERHVFDGNPA